MVIHRNRTFSEVASMVVTWWIYSGLLAQCLGPTHVIDFFEQIECNVFKNKILKALGGNIMLLSLGNITFSTIPLCSFHCNIPNVAY